MEKRNGFLFVCGKSYNYINKVMAGEINPFEPEPIYEKNLFTDFKKMEGEMARFGDIFFRDFVQINGDYYMLDMRFTPDAGNECMAFYCNRQGEVISGLEAWSKRGMRLTRSEFNKCKREFISYMKRKH